MRKPESEWLKTENTQDPIICKDDIKLYEDRLQGKINERNFNMLTAKYQQEQDELHNLIETLHVELQEEKENASNKEKWITLMKQYTAPQELTASLLNALIEKILIHESVETEDGKEQEIEIFYRFIGKIDRFLRSNIFKYVKQTRGIWISDFWTISQNLFRYRSSCYVRHPKSRVRLIREGKTFSRQDNNCPDGSLVVKTVKVRSELHYGGMRKKNFRMTWRCFII